MGPGEAATTKPRTKPRISRLDTAVSHRRHCKAASSGLSAQVRHNSYKRAWYSPVLVEILRNISRRKLRSVLTISGIVIGVLALTTMGAIAENFNALLDGGVKFYSSNILVGPPDGQSASLLPTSKIDEIKQVHGGPAPFPWY